jgi:hypothetical protein
MIPDKLKVTMLIVIALFFIGVLRLLKRHRLQLRYTLLWLFCTFLLFLLILFPQAMTWIGRLVGIQTTMNTLYIFLIGFLIILSLSLTSIVSIQMKEIKTLDQNIALNERRIRNLEEKLQIEDEADKEEKGQL